MQHNCKAQGRIVTKLFQLDWLKSVIAQELKAFGSRFTNLTNNGTALDNNADFIVPTNEYRAGGKLISALDASTIFIKSLDANQDVVAAYIKKSAPKLT